jgi:anti-anti-sigma factor
MSHTFGSADVLPQSLVCSWEEWGTDAAWVQVAGELDLATAPALEQALRGAELRARLVALDLRELTFMDSGGAHVIVHAGIRAQHAGRRLVVLRGPAQVDRFLELSGASEVLEIVDVTGGEPAVQVLRQLNTADPS